MTHQTDKYSSALRRQIYLEVFIKNAVAILVFVFWFLPNISWEFEVLKSSEQSAVLSILGFLMAGAIIGAFELSYSRTNLRSAAQRCLAHSCKFLLYISVFTLFWIGHKTMQVTGGYFVDWISIAAGIIVLSLLIYDLWDAMSAVDQCP